MSRSLFLYEDRQVIDDGVPSRLLEKLGEYHLTSIDERKFMFCGIIGFGNETAAFLPRNSDARSISESDSPKVTAELLKSLTRYLESKANAINAGEIDEDGVMGSEFLGLALSLFEDFFYNGLFARRVAQRRVNQGKTDWAKTIKRSALFVSEEAPIYIDLEGSVKRINADCETARIHAEVLRTLDDRIGWLINGEADQIFNQLTNVVASELDKSAQLNHLRRELHSAYSDRDIQLIRRLMSFIEQDYLMGESSFIIGVRKFEGMWEHMLANTLENVIPVNHRLTKPVYRINGKLIQDRRKGQRTDIVIRDSANSNLTILDAKYYAARSMETAPGWPDLVKQYFYEKAIRSLFPNDKITNVFVFPGEAGPIQSVHMADTKTSTIIEGDLDNVNYPPILCMYLCPLVVIKNYIAGRRRQLIEL